MPKVDSHKLANSLRADVLRMVVKAGAGHVAGPLSAAEILVALYTQDQLRYNVDLPWWEERDRFVLSCGHYAPILYSILARVGFFDKDELMTFMSLGSRLPGHPEYRLLPGVEATTGSLGQGVSFAVGVATALKMRFAERPRDKTPRVYCLMSDGELQEGVVWEALMTSVRRQLDNLIFIVDRNHIQIEQYISRVANYGQLAGRFEGFGLFVLETEGNNLDKLTASLRQARRVEGGPVVVIAETTAGRGVSFMEANPSWHDRVPNKEELTRALLELGENAE